MALKLALPLCGLEPEHFSALSAKLLYVQNLRNSPDSGRASPSSGSESSGVSSLYSVLIGSTESSSTELTPVSSRPETPIEPLYKSQEKREEKSVSLRVLYGERDILNLGANIRGPFWQAREPIIQHPYEDDNFIAIYSAYRRCITGQEHVYTEDYTTKDCDDCGFREPSPHLF